MKKLAFFVAFALAAATGAAYADSKTKKGQARNRRIDFTVTRM